MNPVSLHNPTHRSMWGQCLGDSIAAHISSLDPLHSWSEFSRNQQLSYKRGQLSIYAKQMIGLVDLRQQYPSISATEFTRLAKDLFRKSNGHTLLCRAIKEDQPYSVADLELAVRIGPLATCFSDGLEMLDTVYALTKLFSTHPHSVVGTLTHAAHAWNLAQETPIVTADLFHFMRNWSTKTDIPSETWWMFEQAIRILEQGYPLQEMLDFVNNISGQPKDASPSPRQGLSVLPILFQQTESEMDWSNVLQFKGHVEILMNLKGCLLGLQHEIPTWLASSLSHIKSLQCYPIQQVEPIEKQLRLFDF